MPDFSFQTHNNYTNLYRFLKKIQGIALPHPSSQSLDNCEPKHSMRCLRQPVNLKHPSNTQT